MSEVAILDVGSKDKTGQVTIHDFYSVLQISIHYENHLSYLQLCIILILPELSYQNVRYWLFHFKKSVKDLGSLKVVLPS